MLVQIGEKGLLMKKINKDMANMSIDDAVNDDKCRKILQKMPLFNISKNSSQ